MEPVVAKFKTFREADEATREYYRRLTPGERMEILFKLREAALKESHAPARGLARVYRIVELKQS